MQLFCSRLGEVSHDGGKKDACRDRPVSSRKRTNASRFASSRHETLICEREVPPLTPVRECHFRILACCRPSSGGSKRWVTSNPPHSIARNSAILAGKDVRGSAQTGTGKTRRSGCRFSLLQSHGGCRCLVLEQHANSLRMWRRLSRLRGSWTSEWRSSQAASDSANSVTICAREPTSSWQLRAVARPFEQRERHSRTSRHRAR
jgi:hypothetical protein